MWVLWRGPVGLGDTLDGAVGGTQGEHASVLWLGCGAARRMEPLWCLLCLAIAVPPALAGLSNLSTAAWRAPLPARCPDGFVVLVVHDDIAVALESQARTLALGIRRPLSRTSVAIEHQVAILLEGKKELAATRRLATTQAEVPWRKVDCLATPDKAPAVGK